MSNYTIENNILKVQIAAKGAELQSIYNKEMQLEYLWNGDPEFWGKKSPVLFPIVGGLKNNEYEFEGNKYNLPRHGFARDNEFEVKQIDESTIQCILQSTNNTKQVYPFDFIFIVEYTINDAQLFCTYKVENTGNNTMYFSVGAHPAFAVPLTTDTNFNDWFLNFNTTENCGIHPLTKDGLVIDKATPFLSNTNHLPLSKNLFYNDALVFKQLESTQIIIKSVKSRHSICMQFDGFPYYGIWSAKDANFVCLEPWLGIADSENATGKLQEKEGIIKLPTAERFAATWQVKFEC